jgi:hypothetical protein
VHALGLPSLALRSVQDLGWIWATKINPVAFNPSTSTVFSKGNQQTHYANSGSDGIYLRVADK